ncbi:MAG: RNA-directed DNA polymerase [Acholeplasma sp.]|nr:RNA-directed DNA polymerase [Acholeplasma sp.]
MEKYTKRMIYGTYGKLKAKFFYDNTALLDKLKLAKFEDKDFEIRLNELLSAINCINDNGEFFDTLLKKIDIYPFIKKKDDKGKFDLNYMIDMPIELHIVDTLWTILLAKVLFETESISANIYGNLIDTRNLFNEEIEESINWESKFLFERYVKGYNKWLDNLDKKLKTHRNLQSELSVVVTDFRRFYYSTGNVFKVITSRFPVFFDEHMELTGIVKRIYDIYRKKLMQYSTITLGDGSLPVGLSSSMVLSNLYLYDFDESIVKKSDVLFFGRYVDDMIIIFNRSHSAGSLKEFLDKELYNAIGQSRLSFNDNKTEIFNLSQSKFLNEYDRLMLFLSQKQINYYSNEDEENLSFRRYVNINKKKLNRHLLSKKVDSEESLINFELSDSVLFMNYIYTYVDFKQTTLNELVVKIEKSIEDNYKPSMWKEFYRWFSYFIKDEHKVHEFKRKIDTLIRSLRRMKFNEIRNSNHLNLRNKLVFNYSQVHAISQSLSNSKMFAKSGHTLILGQSKMLNVVSPIRYFIENHRTANLSNNTKFYTDNYSNSVQFIHLWEILAYDQLVNATQNKKKSFKQSIDDFIAINNLESFDYISEENIKQIEGYAAKSLSINYECETEDEIVISHPNICLDKKDSEPLNSWNIKPTFVDTKRLLDNILEAKDNNTSLLVLPELYIDYSWLHIIGLSAQNFNMIISAGMKALVIKKRYFNLMISLYPFKDINKRKNTLVTIREKNNYSYDEENWCTKNSYKLINHLKPTYFLVNHNNVAYSDYMCFEVTDIWARSVFKGIVDVVNIPMLNRDTKYFDSIITSLSRDLSAVIITSNSATWGNSSIILPQGSDNRVVTEFRGGFNQYLVSTKINIKSLIRFNETFLGYDRDKQDKKTFKPHSANFKYKKRVNI